MIDKSNKQYILIIFGVLLVLVTGALILFGGGKKEIEVTSPNGEEKWNTEHTYLVTWESKGIEKIGIVLFEDNVPTWVVKDISAKDGQYSWRIFSLLPPGQDYKIAVFEYPWQEGNKIDYSDESFIIMGPKFASCDFISIENGWPYIPSDYPDLRRVFITEKKWEGDLGGLAGADQKCQNEAEKEENNFGGTWKALLGDDRISAQERIGSKGVFINVKPGVKLPEDKTCHWFIGKNVEDLLEKFSLPEIVVQKQLEKDFFEKWKEIWLGRIKESSPKECLTVIGGIFQRDYYSFTTTCQNWTKGEEKVKLPSGESFPQCYSPAGKLIDAKVFGALASGLIEETSTFTPSQGKTCDDSQYILCVEDLREIGE